MWYDILLWIAHARNFQPRIQAYLWLVVSLFWIIPSKTFSSFIFSWSSLQIGIGFLFVVIIALLPAVLPNIRINLRVVLRNDLFAIVKTSCACIFFNIFFSYGEFMKKHGDWFLCFSSVSFYMYLLSLDRLVQIAEDLGLVDGLIFAVYGQVLGLLELPWAAHLLFSILILFKNLEPPAAQIEDIPEAQDGPEVEDGPEIEEALEADDGPEVDDGPEIEEVPEAEDGQEDVIDIEEVPEAEDGLQMQIQIGMVQAEANPGDGPDEPDPNPGDGPNEANLNQDSKWVYLLALLFTGYFLTLPHCSAFFADHAQANIKILNFTEAVADANKAIELEPTLAKAYLRKGTACMKLGEYSTAKAALEKGASVAPNESKFNKMLDECNLLIAEEEKDLLQQIPHTLPSSFTTPPIATAPDSPPAPSPAAPAKPMFRHEYYQKPEEVVVTIFAKGIPKQNVNVEFGDQILSVVIDVAGEKAYHFQLRLFGKIILEKCRYEVLSTKVEFHLAKAEIIAWASIEYDKGQALLPKPNVASAVSQRPVNPSSKPAKDWDKLEAELKKQDEKLDGDEAMKNIYQSSDEDMRRAMTKSFVS